MASILLSFLAGMVLGQRFKVLILAPAGVIAMALLIGKGFASSASFGATALLTLASLTSMQIGYFVGLAIRHILAGDAVHTPHPRLHGPISERTPL
jgi:hypothetical protein